MHLYQNNLTPTVNTNLADLEEATFSGYAFAAIAAWNPVYVDPQNLATVLGGLVTFVQTADTITNTIYGAFYLDGGGALIWAYRFPSPVPMPGAGSTLPIVPKYQFGAVAP